ncbi:Type II restriction enzyme, methylase subunit YeeA [Pseudomonas chlororaphis subsp. piscium]|uniref:class I SAM-dependent DNA methyltransferase n=1 Tax=Pseudomonas chlororaphis TaxID=587753 RepID=UPI000F5849AF|nr:DNA methyltransferase [Pseudomonas chlororaphis]AZC75332.1 Type II restriction enzyme, methylase subunit YeeA [Pseudomonas chlororaphis subsp. piscium]
MNAVEIESAISDLALLPFDAVEFPFTFLAAFGNKDTTLKRLRAGNNNASDVPGGVLLRSNIHIAPCEPGTVGETLKALRISPASTKAKAKFILATDGQTLEAEELITGETITCDYPDFPNHFGFLLPLAGISTIKEIKDNPIDVRATSRLNKLYVELLNENPDWAKAERRADMNHFMARLVFCFFAEDTDIFNGDGLFTKTVEQYSERDGSNTDQVLSEIFRAMNIKQAERVNAQPRLPSWANTFPYVNGGLFSGSTEVPRFTRMARTYLLHAGNLNWQKINPDIFGSMIQAVADDEERGALGMHYTSVPNILKVLNPLFLDDLRAQLDAAGENRAKLLNLRKRMAHIRVFDPACGSGNFLVIAYKQMREIEAEINRRRGEPHLGSEIPLTNFRGIELRDFPAEIARLALIIAEFQCDVLYRGQIDALAEFLPLDAQNWIICGNALWLDWLSICPPTGTGVKLLADDLFSTPLNQTEIEFANEGGETYICGNPPYVGTKYQTKEQKDDIATLFKSEGINSGNLDYVGCWFLKAAQYTSKIERFAFSFVTTSSLFQGEQAEIVLHILSFYSLKIYWCHPSFMWSNNAANNAGVTCSIVGCARDGARSERYIYGNESRRSVGNIGPYLVPMPDIVVSKRQTPLSETSVMSYGSMSNDNGEFTFTDDRYRASIRANPENKDIFKIAVGGVEFIRGIVRRNIYIDEETTLSDAQYKEFSGVFDCVQEYRAASSREATRKLSATPMYFAERRHVAAKKIFIPQVLSERREYVTAGLLDDDALVIAPHMQIVEGHNYEFALISSRIHHVWISTVCGKLKTDIRYSNLLGWNTFPVPLLTEQNKIDLTACADAILLAREAHFPATIADLYDPDTMPDNLRRAHERNDEVLERVYIGRRFKNDTERLEKLFDLYSKMAANTAKAAPKKTRGKKA